MMFTSWIRQLRSEFSGRAPGRGKHAKARAARGLAQKRRYQPRLEMLEDRCVPSVSIVNGGGLGYVGNGNGGPNDGGPPDVTGMAGPSSYIEVNNSGVTPGLTIFSPKDPRTILASDTIGDFFYNPAIGNQTQIYSQTIAIAASPTGATEAGTTVTITTTAPHGFIVGQSVTISGVGVAGYNSTPATGAFTITGTPTPTTFTYTAPTSGLANSGGGTASASSCGVCDSTGFFDNLMGTDGRFIIADIDVDNVRNVSQLLVAVSTSSNPTALDQAHWNFYHITTTEGPAGSSAWSDYPGNPGFNADAVVFTFNMFGSAPFKGNSQIVSINATDLANGVSQAALNVFSNDQPGQSYRPTTMHDSVAGDPMWLIRNPGNGTSIDVIKMTKVLMKPASFSTKSLPLASKNFVAPGISDPLNTDSTPMNDIDTRILKAGEFNNIVVAAHKIAVGNASVVSATVRLDGNGNPIGGTGYTVGDTLTFNGGTGTKATLTVNTLGAGGSVGTFTLATAGNYSDLNGFDGTVTGGSGSGAKFNVIFRGETDVQWYAIDVSGTPAFQQVGGVDNVGRIGFGANTYTYEPAIDINASGEIGLGFMESDTTGGALSATTGGFPSTFVTARKASDAAGMMQPIVLVPAGKGTANIGSGSTRIGDFSGMSYDPANGTFWHVNEFGGGGPTVIANFTPEEKPMVTPPSDQTAVEGASKSFSLGSFSDPDGSPWKVDVNWGDGTAHTVFTVSSTGTLPDKSHTYAEESAADHAGSNPYVVTVTVTDNTLLSGSGTFNVTVSDPAVTPTGGFTVTAVEGSDSGAQTVATFTDPGVAEGLADYSANIDWGDSTAASSGTISGPDGSGVFTVQGNHTYGEEGATYTITVTIHHETSTDAVTTSSATVSDPAVIATPVQVFAVECLNNTVTVATFTDPGGPEPNAFDPGALANHYKIDSINWGDATPLDTASGTISFDGSSTFTVQGTHAYQHEGVYTVKVDIDHEGIHTSVSTTATIKDDIGLLLLDPTGAQSLQVNGHGIVDATGCGAIIVNSSNATAAFVSGFGQVIGENIDVTGGASTSSHGTFSTTIDHETPNADPLGLGLPPAPSPTFGAVSYSGSAPLTLNPGTYVGGIKISGTGPVTLNPGVYYMKGGGFSVGGQASVTGSNVLIVNASAGSLDTIGVSGQAHVTLTGLTSGPDKGVVILQTSGNPVSFNGQSAVITLTGVVYVPNALVSISGNAFMTIDPGAGTATLPPILGAMIAFDLHVGTNGVLVINPDDPPAGPMAATSGAVATSNGSMPLLVGILPAGGQTSHSSTAGSSTIPATTAPVVDASFSSGVSGTTVIGSNGFAHVSGQTSVWDLDIADIIAGDLIKGLV